MTHLGSPQRWPVLALRRGLVAGWLLLATTGVLPAAEVGTPWAQLTAEQRQVLAPLQTDWAQIDTTRKQKWLEVAGRFRSMSPDERGRVQERMAEWARMTPAERTRARLQFQESRQLSPEERQARWKAYQELPEPERKQLVQQAKQPAKSPTIASDVTAAGRTSSSGAAPSTSKDNEVSAKVALPTRAVTPASVQARPGATTTSIAKRPAPPAHQQAGLPKIAATPTFVDPATLLPRRGPQSAAVSAVSASVSASAAGQPNEQP